MTCSSCIDTGKNTRLNYTYLRIIKIKKVMKLKLYTNKLNSLNCTLDNSIK